MLLKHANKWTYWRVVQYWENLVLIWGTGETSTVHAHSFGLLLHLHCNAVPWELLGRPSPFVYSTVMRRVCAARTRVSLAKAWLRILMGRPLCGPVARATQMLLSCCTSGALQYALIFWSIVLRSNRTALSIRNLCKLYTRKSLKYILYCTRTIIQSCFFMKHFTKRIYSYE